MPFFCNPTPATALYPLSLHDALPISSHPARAIGQATRVDECSASGIASISGEGSEEHTSELQSHVNLVCRLLLEKKKGRPKEESAHDCPPVPRTTRKTSQPQPPKTTR